MNANSKTSPSESIEQLIADASRCVKCGRCLSVCPVYRALGREGGVARGKLSLIESQGGKELKRSSKKLKEIISLCLLCGACTENCPNLVEGDKIIQKARGALFPEKYPALPLKLMLQHILTSPKKMDKLHKAGKLLQPFFLKKIPAESGLHLRFPLSSWGKNRVVPDLVKEPFLKKYSGKKAPANMDVALFVGCVGNYLLPQVPEAAVEIFKRMNLSVQIPHEQGCCGLMAFGAGMDEIDIELIKKNIEAFEKTGSLPIVAPCSSCSAHLKHYPHLFEEGEWKERAKQFSQRVKDSSEFLVETSYAPKGKANTSSVRLTFHDPCHLRRKQGIFEAPRKLLKNIPGVEFIETGNDNLCCGSGGSFNVSHYDLSKKIFQRRIKPIDEKKVDTVVTSCMGCLLQFMDELYHEGKGIRVKHLVEILREDFPR
jgi:glycolate oxidase iron-sulfur subunit